MLEKTNMNRVVITDTIIVIKHFDNNIFFLLTGLIHIYFIVPLANSLQIEFDAIHIIKIIIKKIVFKF